MDTYQEIVQSLSLEEVPLRIRNTNIVLARTDFGREGFTAFFELMHGTPLHKEGKKWVDNIFTAIESGRKKLLQKAFRGSGKSTLFSKLFMAYFIGHFPHTTNGIIRVNREKANETTSEIKELIDNDPLWKLIFPNVIPDKDRGWGAMTGYFFKRTDIENWEEICRQTMRPLGPSLIGYGYDSGSIQGFRVNGLLIVDDILVKENTRSDRQLEDVREFIRFQLKQVLVPRESIEIWNYTPWLANDVYAEREATGLYVMSESPVMKRSDDGVLWPDKLGDEVLDETNYPYANQHWELSWPERWGIKEIAEIYRDVGHIAFAREYMLDLEATKGQLLLKDWLHYYPADKIDPSWPVYMGIDYASVQDRLRHKDRDYFVLAIMRAIPYGGLILIDGYRGHLTKGEALNTTMGYAAQYPTIQRIGVEAIGKGEEFYNDLLLTNDVNGKPLPLMEIKHGRRSKGERFEEWLAPRFQMSRIWVCATPTPFLMEFENEWLMYPNGEHDDCLDGVYMCAFAGEGAMPSKVERSFGRRKRNDNLVQAIGRH